MDSVQGYVSHSGREGEDPGNFPVDVSGYDQSKTDRTQRRVSDDVMTKSKNWRRGIVFGTGHPRPSSVCVCVYLYVYVCEHCVVSLIYIVFIF